MENSPDRIQRIKFAPPPPELPVAGRVDPVEVSFLGRTNYVAALEEKRFIFGMKRLDRRRHLYLIGKGGTGKSKLIELMMRQDIAHGFGACLIDPEGDTIKNILDFVPENRVEDIVLLDPEDQLGAVALNPFAGIDPDSKFQFTHGFVEIMAKQFGPTWSARLEHLTRMACLALVDYPHATLHGLLKLLRNEVYRREVASTVQDEMVRQFWAEEFSDWREKYETDTIIPLLNKMGQFLADPMIGNIFASVENRLDFRTFLQENKIVCVNLARDRIGDANASLLGSLVVLSLKQAAMARVKQRGEVRDFYLYVDEFPNLVTEAFENLLSASRKYGLCFTIAQQHLNQLPASAQAAILGNMGSIIVFRLGGEDAVKLKPEMSPVFDVKDMINLGIGQFYARLLIDGETYDPFSAETLKVLPPPHQSLRDRIYETSHRKYGLRPGPHNKA